MNKTYYKTLDENFTQALNFFETKYSHQELLELLRSGNIVQKQAAALKLETITCENDAQILLDNLTGQDGKIRETVSLRIKEFMENENTRQYFQNPNNYKVFLDAIIDINGNICRNIISAITYLLINDEFCLKFIPQLEELTLSLLDKVEQFDFKEGKYKVNKEAFKLYWCLETIYVFYERINFNKLKEIILRSKNIGEYTIREKAAKILTHNFSDNDLIQARKELNNDPNYYVRRFQ